MGLYVASYPSMSCWPPLMCVALVLWAGACSEGTGGVEPGEVPFSRPDDKTIRLSASPGSLVQTVPAWTLSVDLEMGGSLGEFEAPLDITVLDDGRLLVLDGGSKQALLMDEGGSLIRRIGGPGGGPAEFEHVYGIAAVGGSFVVLSQSNTKVFSVFDTLGQFVRSAPPPVEGDWNLVMRRRFSQRDGRTVVPVAEDITARISELSADRFLHVVGPNENAFPEDSLRKGRFVPGETLVRYGPDLVPLDTVARLWGVPNRVTDYFPVAGGSWVQEVLAPKSVWVGGRGTLAIHQPDEPEVAVVDAEGDVILRLVWEAEERSVTEDDRMGLIHWMLIRDSVHTPPDRQHTLAMGRERAEIQRRQRSIFAFSELLPEVTWLGLSGDCLILAPFHGESNLQGVSLTMLVVDIRTRTPLGLVNLDRVGARVRTAGHGGIWVSYYDPYAAMVFGRFTLPFTQCGPGS